jgi:predicted ribosome quality control (RQC) complex YloA/Tae2 family protein
MALDGFFLSSVVSELNNTVEGSKIDKIYQPEKEEIILNLRSSKGNTKLILSANSSFPRLNTTSKTFKNPQTPPSFCMFLRKHLTSGIIRKIVQINMDRIVMLEIETRDELKTFAIKRLFIEIMGKHSNIVLTDSNNKVLDSIKRIGYNVSSKRQIFPGVKYLAPIFDKKINLMKIDDEIFKKILVESNQGLQLGKFIVKSFYGMSPFLSRELCHRPSLSENDFLGELDESKIDLLYSTISKLKKNIENKDYSPIVYADEESGEYLDFHCFRMTHLEGCSPIDYNSVNEILDVFYYEKANFNSFKQKTSNLRKKISSLLDKNKKKLGKLLQELIKSKNRDIYKTYGDLVIANIYKINKDDEMLEAINYIDNSQVEIRLDKRLTPSQNAQKYYKRYNKLKTAEINLKIQIKITKENIEYLENILYNLESVSEIEVLEEIKKELYETRYINTMEKKKTKIGKSKPICLVSKDGFEILIGKNNIQNDLITFKMSSKEDLWLHAKNVPGSHVIVRAEGKDIPDSTIEEAASYAAFYSKNNKQQKVEIDYTQRYNVKKPKGAKPGFVIFHENYSLIIEPKKPEIKN